MQHLSEFMDSFDYVHSKPAPDWIAAQPQHLVVSSLAASGRDFVAYMADDRELADPTAGESIAGKVTVSLPAGTYDLWLYSPVTGEYSPAIEVRGGDKTEVTLPPFKEDIVIRATRQAE